MKTSHMNVFAKEQFLQSRMRLKKIRQDAELINRLCALNDTLHDADLMLAVNASGQIVIMDRPSGGEVATAFIL